MISESDKKAAQAFYNKLFLFLELNQALRFGGFNIKYIKDMNEKDYHEYLISLEYIHQKGVIDLDKLHNSGKP